MKHPYLISAFLALLPVIAAGVLLMSSNASRDAEANGDIYRCSDASLYFPAEGIIGWTYGDPGSTDRDADGHRTAHTGFDLFAEDGHGATIYAPADGTVSRTWGGDNVNLVFDDVVNVLTDEPGIEVYISHMSNSLVAGRKFEAGDVIGTQVGDHIHMSVGATTGYDDREISQTQDPSPYFNAALRYTAEHLDRRDASEWCLDEPEALQTRARETQAEETQAQEVDLAAPVEENVTHVVVEADTLSSIAETYGTTVEAIAEANGLTDLDYLSLGQELLISGTASVDTDTYAPAEETSDAAESSVEGSQEYVVEEGDTLYGIAEKLGIDVETILELNALVDPDYLSIGDVLIVP